jgi:hypothetical protein
MKNWIPIIIAATLGSSALGCGDVPVEEARDTESVGSTSEALAVPMPESSRKFDGVDDRVTLRHKPAYDFGTGNFTLETTVKIDAERDYEPLLSKRSEGNYAGFLFLYFHGRLLLQVGGNNFYTDALPGLADGNYHHLAVTRSGTTLKFYVDGVLKATRQSAGSMNSAGPLYIGWDAFDGRGLGGVVSEARLWNIARDEAQIAAAMARSAVAPSSPGLVGLLYPESTEAEAVLDHSVLGNTGYFGTELRWDGSDPLLDKLAVMRLASGDPEETPAVDECGGLLVNGVFDRYEHTSDTTIGEYTHHFFCDQEQKNFKLALVAAGKIKLPGKEFDANTDLSVNSTKIKEYCESTESLVTEHNVSTWLSSVASATLVNGYLECKKIITQPDVLVGTSTVSADCGTIMVGLRAKTLVNGQLETEVLDIHTSGATCSGPLTAPDAIVPVGQAATATCIRSGDQPVTIVAATTQGSYFFDFPACGPIGEAWVTGSAPRQVRHEAQKCTTASVGKRTCFGCDPSPHHFSLAIDSGYTAFTNWTWRKTSTYNNIIGPTCGYNANKTALSCWFLRTGGHSAGVEVCDTQYKVETVFDSVPSNKIPIYRNKNFIVDVGKQFQGTTLNVKMNDNNVYLQALDTTPYAAPLELMNKVEDLDSKSYLVKLNQ